MVAIIISSVTLVFNIILWIVVIKMIKKEFSVDGKLQEIQLGVAELIKEIDISTDRNLTLIDAKKDQVNSLLEKADKKIQVFNSEIDNRTAEVQLLRQISSEMQNISDETSEKKLKQAENRRSSSGRKTATAKKNEVAAKAAQSYESTQNLAKSKKTTVDTNYQLFTENAGTSDFQRSIKVFDMPMKDGERVNLVKNSVKNSVKTVKSDVDDDAKSDRDLKNDDYVMESETGLKIKITDDPIKPKVTTGKQILAMSEQGLSSDFIARKLGVSVAEVEMMLAFNGKM